MPPPFSIKLVSDEHRHRPFFWNHDFDGSDGRYALMNFSNRKNTPAIAGRIRIGDRAIVYETSPSQRFTCAIEYIGSLSEGRLAAEAHARLATTGFNNPHTLEPEWRENFLPIRFLAKCDDNLSLAPTRDDLRLANVIDFRPAQEPMRPISEQEYLAIFNAIQWYWRAPEPPS